jgi:hypothetical protein
MRIRAIRDSHPVLAAVAAVSRRSARRADGRPVFI